MSIFHYIYNKNYIWNSIWRGEHITVICHIHEEVFDLPGFCLSCIDSIIQSNLNYYNYDTNYTES